MTDTNELRLWAEFVHEKSRAGSSLQRGNVLSIARTLSSLPNFNQDLLEKEVTKSGFTNHITSTKIKVYRSFIFINNLSLLIFYSYFITGSNKADIRTSPAYFTAQSEEHAAQGKVQT